VTVVLATVQQPVNVAVDLKKVADWLADRTLKRCVSGEIRQPSPEEIQRRLEDADAFRTWAVREYVAAGMGGVAITAKRRLF